MTAPYRLHYAPDNASLIVRLALIELGQPFDTALVDRSTRAQHSAGYRALNPAGRIPVLETPHGPVFETAAILLWLADTHGGLAPQPTDPARGAMLSWLFYLSNTLHSDMRLLFYPGNYAGDDHAGQQALQRQIRDNIRHHLSLLDTAAQQRLPWFNGDTPSLLDLYICPLLRWCALYPQTACGGPPDWFHLAEFPDLHALARRIESRPSAIVAAQAERLGETPFSAPSYARPPEGTAT